jgi:hypothetical protein
MIIAPLFLYRRRLRLRHAVYLRPSPRRASQLAVICGAAMHIWYAFAGMLGCAGSLLPAARTLPSEQALCTRDRHLLAPYDRSQLKLLSLFLSIAVARYLHGRR